MIQKDFLCLMMIYPDDILRDLLISCTRDACKRVNLQSCFSSSHSFLLKLVFEQTWECLAHAQVFGSPVICAFLSLYCGLPQLWSAWLQTWNSTRVFWAVVMYVCPRVNMTHSAFRGNFCFCGQSCTLVLLFHMSHNRPHDRKGLNMQIWC